MLDFAYSRRKNACIRTGSNAGSVPFNANAGSVPFNANHGASEDLARGICLFGFSPDGDTWGEWYL